MLGDEERKLLGTAVDAQAHVTAAQRVLRIDGRVGYDLKLALAHIEVNGKWTHPAWAFLQKSVYWVKQKLHHT